jgi:hypothetical protein
MKNSSKPMSVKGLANIGALLERGDLPKAPAPAPKRDRRTADQIAGRTYEKLKAAMSDLPQAQQDLVITYVKAGLRETYNVGHADALDQNGAVEALLEQQYDARTRLTTPAVVAAVMEQLGSTEMTLDLSMFATVFERKKIDFSVSDQDVITYTLIDNEA